MQTSFKLGLIGHPLSHSLSPQIHTAALRAGSLEGDYSLFPIAHDDMQSLEDILTCVRSGQIHGLNVTIPHKQNVIQFLDKLTPTAKAIGAVNTVYLRRNKLIGDNTDAPGFMSDLNRFLKHSSLATRHSSLVLGSGGSARAVTYALLTNGWNVTLAARRLEETQKLTSSFSNGQLQITSFTDLQPSTFDLIVNTTPVGMIPNINRSPWPENLHFPPHAVVYDLVYNPRQTKLVRDARAQGLFATTGLGMLIEQAALAFELWTGHIPSREAMLHSIAELASGN
jgi:shikimate dehydrogenase